MSQNQTLIGCLATAGQDWHLKIERSKPYFILQSLFEKKDSKPAPPAPPSPLGKYLWLGLFKTPDTHFFSCLLPLPKFGTAGCPPAERRRVDTWVTVFRNFRRSF